MQRLVFRSEEERQFKGTSGAFERVGWVLLCLMLIPQCWNPTIIRDFWGGAPGTNVAGGGNFEAIFNAAADYWELAILDEHSPLISTRLSRCTHPQNLLQSPPQPEQGGRG